ncbi:MAG: hypothetical protein JXA99_01000 [Candidatus Lokiarchaeota archaeon]|nr:hypothetical protein [Candidatus Lokiarchaeota archaeon]
MANSHKYSFFGKNIAIIITSSSKYEPFIYLQCIKRKYDGGWEKPSNGEGRIIKFSLEELIFFNSILNHKKKKWETSHFYKGLETKINLNWDENKPNKIWINIGDYSKLLNYAEAEILKLLLEHILNEKIQYSTISSKNKSKI